VTAPVEPDQPAILGYLPEAYRTGGGVLADFLGPVQAMYDQLGAAIGGLPGLFDPATTPPPQLPYPGADPAAFLAYLAGWLAIPLRPDKPVDWTRTYLARAIELAAERGTYPGVAALLRAWLRGELLAPAEGMPAGRAPLVLTDLAAPVNGVDSPFQLGVQSLLGVHTVLAPAPRGFFVADLVADPAVPDLHTPTGVDAMVRSATALLDAEKPANSYYQLRLRGRTMQLAPADPAAARPGECYAQLPDPAADPPVPGSTLLWDGPWVSGGAPTSYDF
jgi:phage tail-like protein